MCWLVLCTCLTAWLGRLRVDDEDVEVSPSGPVLVVSESGPVALVLVLVLLPVLALAPVLVPVLELAPVLVLVFRFLFDVGLVGSEVEVFEFELLLVLVVLVFALVSLLLLLAAALLWYLLAARLALVVVYCLWIVSSLAAELEALGRLLAFLVLPDW